MNPAVPPSTKRSLELLLMVIEIDDGKIRRSNFKFPR